MEPLTAREIDWAEYLDESRGVPYYVNIHTNETQSEAPESFKEWKEELVRDFLAKSNWRRREHDGKVFYYNKLTQESVWEIPLELLEYEKRLVVLSQQRYQEAAQRKAQAQSQSQSQDQSQSQSQDQDQGQSEGQRNDGFGDDNYWVVGGGEDGDDDGFDSDRTPPDQSPGFISPQYEPSDDEDGVEGGYFYDEEKDFGSVAVQMDSDIPDHSDSQPLLETSKTDEEIAMEEQRLKELVELQRKAEIEVLEKKLSARDAIMEPGVYPQVSKYLQLTGKNPHEVVVSLCRGYVGFAKLTHVVCDWIAMAENLIDGVEGEPLNIVQEAQEKQMNQFVADNLAGLIKTRFKATLADKLMDEVDREPEWLVDMMKNPNETMWRRLLIELSDEHRDSILLNWCIRELSQLGYHREIAQVIREADYFSVCNELLVDTLFRLSTAIVEGGTFGGANISQNEVKSHTDRDSSTSSSTDNIASLMADLKRMCGSTEYMFMYTQHFLSEIMSQLHFNDSHAHKKRTVDDMETCGDTDDEHRGMWKNKIRRIQEELEDEVIWHRDARGFSDRGWKPTPLSSASKFALRLTTENQSINECSTSITNVDGKEDTKKYILESLESGTMTSKVINHLFDQYFERNSGIAIENGGINTVNLLSHVKAVLDSRTDRKDGRFDDMFDILHHPQVLHALIMFGIEGAAVSSSSGNMSTLACRRESIACILALASCTNGISKCTADSVFHLAEKAKTVFDICQNLGSLSSNLYTASKSSVIFGLMKESSLLSRVFLSWLEMKVHENLFVIRAKQLAVYPVILQMIVVGINTYASQRHQCFRIIVTAFRVISQASTSEDVGKVGTLDRDSIREKDMSESTLNVRQDLIDISIHLIGKGFINEPLLFFCDNIDAMDKALIRHIVISLLSVVDINGKFSAEFIGAFCRVLLLPKTRECMQSNLFSRAGANTLVSFRDKVFGSPSSSQRIDNIIEIDMREKIDELVKNTLMLARK